MSAFALDPGSTLGHALGVAGLALMLFAQLGYSWRKRPPRSGPGPVRTWLAAHVWAGLLGPLLVLLHGGFRFRGLAGAVTLLVLVVAASGVAGRVMYAETPRGGPARRRLAPWWVLHVPVALAMLALALVHAAAALYYAG